MFYVCICAAYGPAVIEHSLLVSTFPPNAKIGKDVDATKGI